jgi:CheY-like chemotaxis protein
VVFSKEVKVTMSKVLIVEDDADICETYTDILEAAGHIVMAVDRVTKAYQCLPKFRPDVVVLDMLLPGDSGMLVVAFIRRYPRLSKVKLVVISGHPEMASRAVTLFGADMFLTKPVSAEQLRTTIRDLVPAKVDYVQNVSK